MKVFTRRVHNYTFSDYYLSIVNMKIFYIAALLSLSGGAFAGVSPELSVRTASCIFFGIESFIDSCERLRGAFSVFG